MPNPLLPFSVVSCTPCVFSLPSGRPCIIWISGSWRYSVFLPMSAGVLRMGCLCMRLLPASVCLRVCSQTCAWGLSDPLPSACTVVRSSVCRGLRPSLLVLDQQPLRVPSATALPCLGLHLVGCAVPAQRLGELPMLLLPGLEGVWVSTSADSHPSQPLSLLLPLKSDRDEPLHRCLPP